MIKQVLWSGGLDSTYMIYKYLQEHHRVEAYYIEIKNNKEKTKRELTSIKELCKLFKDYAFEYKGILAEFSLNIIDDNVSAFHQSPFWITSAYYLKGPVSIGYVMNDDSISYLQDYNNIAKSYNTLRNTPLKLEFPLYKTSKQEILKYLPKEYLKHITYCESEEKLTSCGKCHSCRRYKTIIDENK